MAKQYEQKPPTEEEALKASEAGLKLVTEQIEKSRAAQEKLNEAAKKGVEIAEDEKNELEKQADIQAKINSLKEQATTESQRLRELSDISRDITKELLGSEEKRNKILAERRGAQKAQFTQNIAQLAAAKDENDLVEISKRLTQEKNILTSNGGGLSLKDNINRQEEIDYLLELISLKQKENQLSAAGFDTSEASQEKIKQQLDEQNAIIDFSEKQLEIMQQKAELAAIIDKHSQSIISNITSAIDSTGDIFSKIPLMGGMIKGKFDELSETLKGKLTDAAAAFKEKFAQNLAAGQNSMAAMRNAVASVGPAISAAWAAAAPLLFLAALAIGVKRADEMEQAAIDMRKALGGSAADAKEMAKELAEAESAVKQIGGTLVDAADAAKTLRETLGTIEPITSGTVSTMVLLNKNLGIANEKSAEVIGLFQNLGGLTQQAAAGALLMTTEMAKAAGLSAETIVNDIADAAANGEDLYLTVKGGAKEIAKMAIQARLLGTSIESAVKSSKTLLDFEQSIQDELEASAILGMDLNFQKARELAYNGDIAGSQREIMNQLRGIQDIGSLTLYEKEALAKATGMEIADLTKMQRIQRQFPGIEEEKMNAAMKLADKYGDISKITDDMLSAEVQRAAQEEKMTTTLQQLKDGFAAIGVELAEVLLPLGQAFLFILRYTLLPTLRLIAGTIKFIGDGFKSLISLFTDAEAPLSGMTKWLGIGAAILTLIIARTIIWKGVTMAVNGAVMVLRFTYLALLGVWQLLKGAGTIFTPGFWSNAAASAKGFFNNMGNMIRGVPKPPPVAPTVPTQAPAAGAGSRFGAMRQQVLERRAAGGGLNNRTAPTTAPTTTAPSQAPAPTQQANQNPARGASAINASQILAAAAAMIAFAVAIYILAKAFQEFDKVKNVGQTMALFGVAVLGLVAVLYVAGTALTAASPVLYAAAVVLLAFGASVLLISAGMYIAAKAFGVFVAAINNFGPGLTSLSAGITAFVASPYIQFGIGLAALGIALTAFALLSPTILIGAGALMLLGTALSAINVNMDGLKSLTETIKGFETAPFITFSVAIGIFGATLTSLALLTPFIGLGIIAAMLLVIAAGNIQSAFTKIGNIDTTQIQNLIQSIAPLRAALFSLAGLIFIATAITVGIPMLALAFSALAIVMPVISNISKTFTELSTALTNIASSIPKIIEQIIRLTTTNFTPIYQLADAINSLTDALFKLSMMSLLSLPMLSKINELTGVNILGNTNVPVKPVATAAVSLPTIPAQPTKETTINKEIETQQFTKDLIAQIIGLRSDLNQGKVAVYLDGTKVMKELKGVDSRELVTDRPRR